MCTNQYIHEPWLTFFSLLIYYSELRRFGSQCLSNAKHLFSETLSPKNHSQVSFDKQGYQYEVLVSFNSTPHNMTAATHTGYQISLPWSIERNVFARQLRSLFGVNYHKIHDVGMKRRALKVKYDCSFWSSTKGCKGFSKINDSVKHIWEFSVLHYHKIMVINSLLFWGGYHPTFSLIIFINYCICILPGLPG